MLLKLSVILLITIGCSSKQSKLSESNSTKAQYSIEIRTVADPEGYYDEFWSMYREKGEIIIFSEEDSLHYK